MWDNPVKNYWLCKEAYIVNHGQKKNQSIETFKIIQIIELVGNYNYLKNTESLNKITNRMGSNGRHEFGVAILMSNKMSIKTEY